MTYYSVSLVILTAIVATTQLQTSSARASEEQCSLCIQNNTQGWCGKQKSLTSIDRRHETRRCSQLDIMKQNCGDDLQNYYSTFSEFEKKNYTKSTVYNYSSGSSIHVPLPLNVVQTIKIHYEEIDKPFDLYYLVDVSGTMKTHLESVVKQGHVLGDRLKKLSAEYRIGFGTFIDKKAYPFGGTYLFHNALSLTSNITAFIKAVNDTKILTNHDLPEGSLEAMVQVLSCNELIGWRNESTKLIIIATDGTYHIGGDAKVAGILSPNDLQCHTTSETNYTHADLQDYPSINQISRLLKKTGTFVAFAVTDDMTIFYNRLTKAINDHFLLSIQRAYSSSLGNDTSSTVNIIEERYNSITTELSLEHELNFKSPNSGINISYYYSCPNENEIQGPKKSILCSNVTTGDKISFSMDISVDASICEDISGENYIKVLRSGRTEGLKIYLQPACKCSCENEKLEFAELCNEKGVLVCGHCECYSGYIGEDCSCSEADNKIQNCKDPAAPTTPCNSRGTCFCGQCHCDDRYNGTYCQFDLASCFPDGQLPTKAELPAQFSNTTVTPPPHWCSGHGQCVNGICNETCDSGYEGEFCYCESDNSNCKEPGTNSTIFSETICGNAGPEACLCTSDPNSDALQKKYCNCTSVSSSFRGKYCESFSSEDWGDTHNRFCSDTQISNMVQEMHKLRSGIHENGLENFTCVTGHWTDKNDNQDQYSPCTTPETDTDCTLTYLYGYGYADQRDACLHIITSKNFKTCPSKDYLYIIAGVVASILLIGLATLIAWKCIISVQDEREYGKFEEAIETIQFGQDINPLWKAPVTHVENPLYRKSGGGNRRSRISVDRDRRSELRGFRRSAHIMADLIDGRY